MNHYKTEVDLDIDRLIKEMEKADLCTLCSCQKSRESDYFCVNFPSFYEVTQFLRIAAKNEKNSNSLYEHIFVPEKISWNYEVQAVDVSVYLNDTDLKSNDDESEDSYVVDFEFCVLIPESDYDAVLASLQNYNN